MANGNAKLHVWSAVQLSVIKRGSWEMIITNKEIEGQNSYEVV